MKKEILSYLTSTMNRTQRTIERLENINPTNATALAAHRQAYDEFVDLYDFIADMEDTSECMCSDAADKFNFDDETEDCDHDCANCSEVSTTPDDSVTKIIGYDDKGLEVVEFDSFILLGIEHKGNFTKYRAEAHNVSIQDVMTLNEESVKLAHDMMSNSKEE